MARVASSYDLVHAGSLLLGSAPVSVEKKAPALTLPQVHLLVCGGIPTQTFDAHWVLEVVAYGQHRNSGPITPIASTGSPDSTSWKRSLRP